MGKKSDRLKRGLESPLQVSIVYGSLEEGCTAECGLDWSSAEAVGLVNERVKERFGNRVKIVILDLLSKDFNRDQGPGRLIRDKNLAVPALVINGRPGFRGSSISVCCSMQSRPNWK